MLKIQKRSQYVIFYQNWYFYNRRNCCTSIRCVLTYCSLPRHETIIITLYETIIITRFMSLMSLSLMLPCILTERNKGPYCNVYNMQIESLLVHHITCNHCLLKKFFFSVSMKIFIISERSSCMNKASSVTDSYLQNFFLSKSIYFLY